MNFIKGSIELTCDGLTVPNKTFSHLSIVFVDDPSYDLVVAIKYLWVHSPLLWKFRHIRGHQDVYKAQEDLDRWERLNTAVEAVAKAHIAEAQRKPMHLYWVAKHQLTPKIMDSINWLVVKKAHGESNISRCTFITKLTAGMCGVGKFMLWKESL